MSDVGNWIDDGTRELDQPRAEAVTQEVVERVWKAPRRGGLVVGVGGPRWRFVLGFGHVARGDVMPTAETVFEIASVTKVFTALALVILAGRRLVQLDDPVRMALPETVRVPSWHGREITLRQLCLHTSGLPKHPRGTPWRWLRHPSRPYAGLTTGAVFRDLGRTRLRNEPGSRWEYSNLGMGMLGIALAQVTGASYETLINDLICAPLGLGHTRVAPTADDQLAVGYGRFGHALEPGSHGSLAGAGDLRSCAADLMEFTRLGFGEGPDELVRAARDSLAVRFPVSDGSEQALGWRIWRVRDDEWPGHGGDSAGFRSSVSFHVPSRTALVALSNGTHGAQTWFDALVPELWKGLQAASSRPSSRFHDAMR